MPEMEQFTFSVEPKKAGDVLKKIVDALVADGVPEATIRVQNVDVEVPDEEEAA
jgi:hypothetical protein